VATADAVHWAGLKPVFADILPDTFTLDPAAVEAAITPRTAAILSVHIYGHPCEVDALGEIAQRRGLALLYDAAHATGSRYAGRPVGGFGDAEVFSFHATKIFPVGEGGCITTRIGPLAETVTLMRKFGDPGDENTLIPGINAKMQEFNAIMGLAVMKVIDQHIANRRRYAARLVERLGRLPGIRFQAIRPLAFMNYQNFALLVDAEGFGLGREQLYAALAAENILPRKYFYPPVHWHTAYMAYRSAWLPVTEQISSQVLCLPFYSEMSDEILDILGTAIERIQAYAPQIRRKLLSSCELNPSLAVPAQWAWHN
jgi:dTDP-4-amino-4,6-dideoxygalactose transaminase